MIATIVFPHQLFEQNPAIVPDAEVFLVEEFLFFRQYNFHRQKLKHHRATMKFYESHLLRKGLKVVYVESTSELSDVRKLIPTLIESGVDEIHFCDVADNWLEKRIRRFGAEVRLVEHESPMFLNSRADLQAYFQTKKHYFQTDFYTNQRKKRQILLDDQFQPVGGKWSFDTENRLKYPKARVPPQVEFPAENGFVREATYHVEANFNDNYGALNGPFIYPTTYVESRRWLDQF
ncbi:MAG: cryptochrome/photolyase family protein, partial [Pyrinomonadaceae bacterium]